MRNIKLGKRLLAAMIGTATMMTGISSISLSAAPFDLQSGYSDAALVTAGGGYTVNVNKTIDYSALPESDRMVGFDWSAFNIPQGEKITKVDFNLSTTKDKLGKWQGAFGTSTNVAPDYWTQTSASSQTFSGNTGTLTWEMDSATSAIVQTQYGGELKLGIWWIDCTTFTVDSITVYTNNSTGGGGSTGGGSTSSTGGYKLDLNQSIVYSQLPENDRMIGWEWSKFGIGQGETVTQVDFNISTPKDKIGKWQGAFGTSTSVAPDYWTQTTATSKTINDKSGTITWTVDSATASIIQMQYGGELKFGTWWIDCDEFVVDSIIVYTDKNPAGVVTTTAAMTTTTKAATTTTTAKATTTTKANTTTAAPTTTKAPITTTTAGPIKVLRGDVNEDGKVTLADLVRLSKVQAGMVQLSEAAEKNADCDADGSVTDQDITTLAQYLARIINSL